MTTVYSVKSYIRPLEGNQKWMSTLKNKFGLGGRKIHKCHHNVFHTLFIQMWLEYKMPPKDS